MPTSSDSNAAVAAGNVMQADPDNLVQRVAARIRSRFAEEASGHDWHHIHRVWRLARKIAVAEGARLDVVELAALAHDIADWKFHGGDDAIGPREAERLLREEGAGDDLVEPVVEIVATISFKGAGVRQPMRTLEGQCVQDADRLDAIGAIGIVSVITGFDVAMFTLRDGERPLERRAALLLEREAALHFSSVKAMPFGCGLRPQP